MDYEQKYNEAMLRADEAVQKGCLDKDIFDIIFPPEESEDERIRKWLVNYFTNIGDAWIHRDFTCEQIRAWLEKQKEQKPELSEDIKRTLDDVSRLLIMLNYKETARNYKQAIEQLISLRPQKKED